MDFVISYFADTVNALVDYDINILFTGAGLLRQSNFDVVLHAAGESMMVLQVYIQAMCPQS